MNPGSPARTAPPICGRCTAAEESIGRGAALQEEDGGLTREWFAAERKAGAFYEPIKGRHATFEEALDRVVFYDVEQ